MGDIFLGWDDRVWILDGAAVQVSIIGFDDGEETRKSLNGLNVDKINSDLTSTVDITKAQTLRKNLGLSFKGIEKAGSFDISASQAQKLLKLSNTTDVPNKEVIKPIVNGRDILGRNQDRWIIDFTGMSMDEAQKYENPFEYILENVKPSRDKNRRKARKEQWWLFGETRPAMRQAISTLERYIVTTRVAKHRIFSFLDVNLMPDDALI